MALLAKIGIYISLFIALSESFASAQEMQACGETQAKHLKRFEQFLIKTNNRDITESSIRAFIEDGLELNCKSKTSFYLFDRNNAHDTTSLLSAIATCKKEAVRVLLNLGANVEFTDKEGKNISIFPDLFFNWGKVHQPVNNFHCASDDEVSIYRLVLSKVINPTAESLNAELYSRYFDFYYSTATTLAIYHKDAFALEFLLFEAHQNPNQGHPGYPYLVDVVTSADSYQSISEPAQKMKLLISAGADWKYVSSDYGLNLLDFAKIYNRSKPDHMKDLFPPCGLIGTIDQRISDCKNYSTLDTDLNVKLVSRTKGFEELYYDKNSKIFWGDFVKTRWSYNGNLGVKFQKWMNDQCGNYSILYPDFPSLNWSAPTKEEIENSVTTGALSKFGYLNWYHMASQTITNNEVWIKEGQNPSSSDEIFVSCIAKNEYAFN